ncbi:hypothetical protein [Micromonospora radicis]|uniref:Uncharacterized protein n=1 Tax=Micromonospora radicis TaxID=1894971 RepID=A0A418MXM0_9ACTN|nr:hypothetical protein [Micromonospora radicis]RIV39671.1 hypothetical protein D2L64_07575 [Micromonospora radicis]
MLPVAATHPLWWLARRAARLLTSFAVAAAFTLGAWAVPAHATPGALPGLATAAPGQADRAEVAPPTSRLDLHSGAGRAVVGPVVPAGSGPDRFTAVPALGSSAATGGDRSDHAGPAQPPATPGRSRPWAVGPVAVGPTPALVAAVPGAHPTRGPPRG